MLDGVIIVIGLTILNSAVFLALVISLIRARKREESSSFKFTPVESEPEAAGIADKDPVIFNESREAQEALSAMAEAERRSRAAKSKEESQKRPREREKVTVG